MKCQPAIEIKNLVFEYPDGTRAVDGVTLTIAEGERVAMIGPNGAGKSTLLKQLNGVFLPSSGEVCICGDCVEKSSLEKIRSQVGLVFQDPDDQLFSTTVWDDVAFGPRNQGLDADTVAERVNFALELMGLERLAKRPAHHLSFGQKKRVATATVISMMPRIWAFDEPSSNLDPRSQRVLERFLSSREETVVMVTQDLVFATETCDRLIVFADGKIMADGPILDVLRDKELLDTLGLDFSRFCRICRELHPED